MHAIPPVCARLAAPALVGVCMMASPTQGDRWYLEGSSMSPVGALRDHCAAWHACHSLLPLTSGSSQTTAAAGLTATCAATGRVLQDAAASFVAHLLQICLIIKPAPLPRTKGPLAASLAPCTALPEPKLQQGPQVVTLSPPTPAGTGSQQLALTQLAADYLPQQGSDACQRSDGHAIPQRRARAAPAGPSGRRRPGRVTGQAGQRGAAQGEAGGTGPC